MIEKEEAGCWGTLISYNNCSKAAPGGLKKEARAQTCRSTHHTTITQENSNAVAPAP